MREHKYKVWDKDQREWLNLAEEIFIIYDGQKMEVAEGNESYGELHENVEIVEWSGLKDKNGKEIYEGDILKIANKVYAFVGWNDETAAFAAKAIGGDSFSDHLYGAEITEIVGNIYENPELLEGN